jgi:hypothetical protein
MKKIIFFRVVCLAYSVDEDIEEYEHIVQIFVEIINAKRPNMKSGEKMSLENKTLANSRSDNWLSFIRSAWMNSGFFDKENPTTNSCCRGIDPQIIITDFSKFIFEKVFYSQEKITFQKEGSVSTYDIISPKGNYIFSIYSKIKEHYFIVRH